MLPQVRVTLFQPPSYAPPPAFLTGLISLPISQVFITKGAFDVKRFLTLSAFGFLYHGYVVLLQLLKPPRAPPLPPC